jgi:hypothetical protein
MKCEVISNISRTPFSPWILGKKCAAYTCVNTVNDFVLWFYERELDSTVLPIPKFVLFKVLQKRTKETPFCQVVWDIKDTLSLKYKIHELGDMEYVY